MGRVNGRAYAGIAAVLGAERCLELAWSRRNLRRSLPGPAASPRTFPMMGAVNVALFTVPAISRYRRPPPSWPVRLVALGGVVGALVLRFRVITTLGAAWNVVASVPPDLVPVRRGPYRWVRHPNYVAVALEFAALPAAAGAYFQAVLLSAANAVLLWRRIRAEEALLDDIPGYRESFAGVPRFIPRLRSGRSGS